MITCNTYKTWRVSECEREDKREYECDFDFEHDFHCKREQDFQREC